MRTKYHSGLFEDQNSAEKAYQNALNRGYKSEEINVLMSEDTKKRYSDSRIAEVEVGNKSVEGLAIGGAVGGTLLGSIAAALAVSSNIVIPGLGLILIGPLAAGLVGAGAGSIAGGVLGAIIGFGVPEEQAKVYENGIKKGGTVILVPKREKDDTLLLDDWRKNNGKDVY